MSSRKVRVTAFAAVLAAALIGVYAYLSPASDAAVSFPDGPDMANPTVEPWSNYLSKDAVDSNSIELDVDGNSSALVPSDQINALR